MVIRLGVICDIGAVERIVMEAYGVYLDRMGKKPAPMLDDYRDLIQRQRVHVVDEGDVIRGVLVLVPMEKYMLVENVAVHPDFQGHGYGRILLDYADDTAKSSGYAEIRLYTHERMIENQEIYRHLGWREYMRKTENGYSRVYLKKTL